MSSNLRYKVNKMWTRPATYIWTLDEDNDGDDEE